MEGNKEKNWGLRSRITAWIVGILVVMALFFFSFVSYQSRAVYIGTLDAALFTWGEQVALGRTQGLSAKVTAAGGERSDGPFAFSFGGLLEGSGRPDRWERFGPAAQNVGEGLAAHVDLLRAARHAGRALTRTVELEAGTFRLMALPPMRAEEKGALVFTPLAAHTPGTEGLSLRFVLAVIFLLLVVMAGGSLFAWLLIRPLEELRDVAEKIADGNLEEGVQFTGSSEFVSLSRSINRMRRSIAETLRGSASQNQALTEKGQELASSNRELERAIFKANQMTAEAEIHSYELEHEIVQRRQAEEALRSSEEKYRTIVENMKEGYCEVDRQGCLTFVNTAICEISGYDSAELLGVPSERFIADASRRKVLSLVSGLLAGDEDVSEFDYPMRRKDGQTRHLGVSVSMIRNLAGERVGFRAIVRDVEARKRYEEELIYMAYHDPLTGLKNRKGFYERLDADILRAKRYGGQVTLLYIDIDRFKEVNDTLGHEAGDEVLQEITRRLLANLRQCDCVARVGGDEFAVVFDNDGGCEADVVVRKVAAILAQPYRVGDHEVNYVSGSVGVALFPEDAVTASDLIRYADNAMYMVKREHKALADVRQAEGVPA